MSKFLHYTVKAASLLFYGLSIAFERLAVLFNGAHDVLEAAIRPAPPPLPKTGTTTMVAAEEGAATPRAVLSPVGVVAGTKVTAPDPTRPIIIGGGKPKE
jgi:hypothetical protein